MASTCRSLLTLSAIVAHPAAGLGKYGLHKSMVGEDFFDEQTWSFFTDADPTQGAVDYVDKETATAKKMIKAENGRVYVGPGLDGLQVNDSVPSVRLESVEIFSNILIVVSMEHQPTGCGVWPAFWMAGWDEDHPWPTWGEADFLEGAHGQTQVWTTLHTWEGCDQATMKSGEDFTGVWQAGAGNKTEATNCSVIAADQVRNEGCPITGPVGTMGAPFNAAGGGTFAFEWDPAMHRFQAFFWPRGTEPADIDAKKPVPEGWGLPYAKFVTNTPQCPSRLFQNMRIIINTDFCGQWGVPEEAFHKACPDIPKNLTCPEYVSMYPEKLKEAYWSFTRLDLYKRGPHAEEEQLEEIVV